MTSLLYLQNKNRAAQIAKAKKVVRKWVQQGKDLVRKAAEDAAKKLDGKEKREGEKQEEDQQQEEDEKQEMEDAAEADYDTDDATCDAEEDTKDVAAVTDTGVMDAGTFDEATGGKEDKDAADLEQPDRAGEVHMGDTQFNPNRVTMSIVETVAKV